ncbi:MAG: hypothetical protein K0S44_1601 [Bacteroidetes bacterium]|jgi:hypothetical protein|nr:hypothetical protein [Bacteroidota bacterium]
MTFRKFILTVLILSSPLFTIDALAAGMGMGPPLPCGGPFPPCPIPLDSGVVLLLIAGATYGGYKIYSTLKKNPA